jgi:hypothetical protein
LLNIAVSGYKRVPLPPARMMPFVFFMLRKDAKVKNWSKNQMVKNIERHKIQCFQGMQKLFSHKKRMRKNVCIALQRALDTSL